MEQGLSTQQPESIAQERKYKWSKRILVFAVIILFMRLFDLQILKGDEMRRQSEQNRVRIKKILAPRGTIFDRKGRILGNTRPSFNLYIIPKTSRTSRRRWTASSTCSSWTVMTSWKD